MCRIILMSTEDGDPITAHKPITNSAGKVVAVLGCDYDASDITARLEEASLWSGQRLVRSALSWQ